MDDSCTPCSEISAEDFFAEAMRRSVRSERSISRHRFHSSLLFHRCYSYIIELLILELPIPITFMVSNDS